MMPHDTIENTISENRTMSVGTDECSLMSRMMPLPPRDGAGAPFACRPSSRDPSVRKQASGQVQNAPLGQRGWVMVARPEIAVKRMVGLEFPSSDAPLPTH